MLYPSLLVNFLYRQNKRLRKQEETVILRKIETKEVFYMGFGEWFTFKTAKQRAREEKMFARWAFPYGDAQKEKVSQIIRELMPKEDPRSGLAVFLMGRQAYRGSFKDDPEDLAERTEEDKMAAGTALASCGIAYAMKYIQASADAGESLGFSAEQAGKIVEYTVKGAASLLLSTGNPPQVEIDKVTTPGGMTMKGLAAMEEAGFAQAVAAGVNGCLK